MTDPFEALYAPVEPIAADPRFTTRLRARLERALALPEGVDMPRSVLAPDPLGTEPAAMAGVQPYLALADARRALAWYVDALDAQPHGEPIVMDDGRIGHAELVLAGTVVMFADPFPEIGVTAPVPGQGVAVSLRIEVADVDALTERAVAAGARLDRPPADYPHGRNAVIIDPFGHRWLLSASLAATVAPTDPTTTTPVVYASLWLPDVEAGAAFYGSVLGWRFEPGSAEQSRRVEGRALGLWGGPEQSTLLPVVAVDDAAATVERVRAAGGQAEDPKDEHGGLVADCTDDQGLSFSVYQAIEQAPAAVATGPGELAYLTIGVPDAARARAFYSSVLGWRFTPGRIEDGWNVEGVTPMAGMYGGAERPVVVPMFAVDDIESAVARVRVAGGTATDPEQMPYGITSDCTDDQGFSFYLGQLG